jgi:hypothetical protein
VGVGAHQSRREPVQQEDARVCDLHGGTGRAAAQPVLCKVFPDQLERGRRYVGKSPQKLGAAEHGGAHRIGLERRAKCGAHPPVQPDGGVLVELVQQRVVAEHRALLLQEGPRQHVDLVDRELVRGDPLQHQLEDAAEIGERGHGARLEEEAVLILRVAALAGAVHAARVLASAQRVNRIDDPEDEVLSMQIRHGSGLLLVHPCMRSSGAIGSRSRACGAIRPWEK